MTMPYEMFAPEQLTINGVDMLGPAWIVLDMSNLWIPTATWDNRVAPGVAGSNAEPGIENELRTSLPFKLTGECDRFGDPTSSPRVGFRRNWNYLRLNLLLLDGSVTSFDATYQSADVDEAPIEFQIQVLDITISERTPTDWSGSLQVCLPAGALPSL